MKYRNFVTSVTGISTNEDATGYTGLQVVEESTVTSVTSVTAKKEQLCCTEDLSTGFPVNNGFRNDARDDACVQSLAMLQKSGYTGYTGYTLEVEVLPATETTGYNTGNKNGYTRIPLPGYAEDELFLIEAIHGEEWLDPERIEKWAPKKQLAQTASDLARQNVVPKEAYGMCVFAGFTGKEAGYIAKLVRDGDWRAILEEKHCTPPTDRLAALLESAECIHTQQGVFTHEKTV